MTNISQPIDDLIKTAIEQGDIPGAVVLVSVGGDTIMHQAHGYAQLYDRDILLDEPIPMREDTLFDLASLTKVMATTLGVMKLMTDGLLTDLSVSISDFLPACATHGKEAITLSDLLTHTSGFMPWFPIYLDVNARKDVLNYLCDLPLTDTPGEQRQYSDINFMLLGLVIEVITNQPLEDYLATHLYKPLSLSRIGFKPNYPDQVAATSWGNPYEYKMIDDDSFGHTIIERAPDEFTGWRDYTLKGEVNDGNAFYAFEGVAGHAGLFGCASDLARLGQLLLDGGQYKQLSLLDKKVVDTFTVPQRFGQGYGFEIDEPAYMGQYAPQGTFGHSGFTGVHMILNRQHNMQIILLTNRQNLGVNAKGYYPNVRPLAGAIADVIFRGAP